MSEFEKGFVNFVKTLMFGKTMESVRNRTKFIFIQKQNGEEVVH